MLSEQTIHAIMRMCADGIGPALLFSVLSEVPLALRSAPPGTRFAALIRAGRFCLAGLIAIAVPVVLAEMGKQHVVWNGHPGFPSGHTTFTAAASAAIVTYRGNQWLVLCAPATVLMMVALVYLRHHDPPEVLGGLLLGATLGTVITRLLTKREG